jgi:hypothetical protein
VAKVTMLLAYAPDRPEGDLAHRLELTVVLTPQGQLDDAAFAADPTPWPSRRILPDGAEHVGELVGLEGGWALRSALSEDAPLWALEGKVYRPGELVTLRRPDGQELVFRIVNVEAEPDPSC